MKDDTQELLSDILRDWHSWAKGYQHVVSVGTSPMFRDAKAPRGWDTTDEIIKNELDNSRMVAVDFHISQLCDVYRTALQIQARNLCTGKNVWISARLPEKTDDRIKILMEARTSLLVRLRDSGIV